MINNTIVPANDDWSHLQLSLYDASWGAQFERRQCALHDKILEQQDLLPFSILSLVSEYGRRKWHHVEVGDLLMVKDTRQHWQE